MNIAANCVANTNENVESSIQPNISQPINKDVFTFNTLGNTENIDVVSPRQVIAIPVETEIPEKLDINQTCNIYTDKVFIGISNQDTDKIFKRKSNDSESSILGLFSLCCTTNSRGSNTN
tara:strand:+ start:2931 stop:3290 length:360 start_codon:yes stop_codon:yes gene_type:complete